MADEKERLLALMSRQASESRAAQAQGQIRRVVKGMMLSKLRRGWQTWIHQERAFAEAKQRKERRAQTLAVAYKALTRLSMSTLGAAWNSWNAEVKRYEEERKAMSQLLSRIFRFKLSLGWNQWVTMPAPLSLAHIVTALATWSAIFGFSCHLMLSSVLPGRPTFSR